MHKSGIFLLLGTFALGMLAGYFLGSRPSEEISKPVAVSSAPPVPSQNTVSVDKIDRIVMNGSAQQPQENKLPQPESEMELPPDSSDVQAPKTDAQGLVAGAMEGREQMEAFSEFIQKSRASNTPPIELASSNFENEPVNYEWAAVKEDELLQSFESQSDLMDIAPLSIVCKTENCQIVIAVEDQIQAQDFSARFTRALTSGEGGHGLSSVSYFIDENSGEMTFYLSENYKKGVFQ